MLVPQKITLFCYRSGTYDEQLLFWQDDAKTIPFDFSTWNVSMTATDEGTVNQAITVAKSSGQLLLSLTPEQTAALDAGVLHHYIKLVDVSDPEHVEFLANGPFTVLDP